MYVLLLLLPISLVAVHYITKPPHTHGHVITEPSVCAYVHQLDVNSRRAIIIIMCFFLKHRYQPP